MPKLEQNVLHKEIETFVIWKGSKEDTDWMLFSDKQMPSKQMLYLMEMESPETNACFRLVHEFSNGPKQYKGYIFTCAHLLKNYRNQI